MLRAVLFDLDDTLFDHEQCAREALSAVHRSHDAFSGTAFAEFERAHAGHLEDLHMQVLTGEIDLDSARIERFRRLFEQTGAVPENAPAEAARLYRESYVRSRKAIEGAGELLRRLRERVKIGVVSNNLLEEQQEKLRQCQLDTCVDALIVSEEVGVTKPDPGIFRVALLRLEVTAEEALMIGDSWRADIAGARAAGIPAIWFNRNAAPHPNPEWGVPELRSLEPPDRVIDFIHLAHRTASANRR